MLRGRGGEWESRGKDGKRISPLKLANASRADDDHGWFHVVDDIEQHVSGVLGVPGLAGYGDIELGSLQKADGLPNKDVSQALALRKGLTERADRGERGEWRTSC